MSKKKRLFPGKSTHHAGTGLRLVALFEAAKGGLVVAVGLGLLVLVHRDIQSVAEEIVRHLHLNPAKQYPRIFLDVAGQLQNVRLWAMAATASLYASVRFAEAYGLWFRQEWAVWFGILSGGIYLPLEIYELTVSVSALKAILLLVNLFVVGWLVWTRRPLVSGGKHPRK